MSTSFKTLSARIEMPASVRAGDTLHYAVLLIDTSAIVDAVLWSAPDCPIYHQTLAGSTGQYVLNCAAANSFTIPRGHAIRFEMELRVPSSVPAGPSTLMWQTTEPTGLSAIAPATVTDA